MITGSVTLDAQDDPDTVFIFQMSSTLTTAVGSSVVLTNGAQACNVYWQVGSSAALFSNSTFRGTILALTSISLGTGASISGRALARNGAVTMDSNSITRVGCAAPVDTTTTTTTMAPTTTTTVAATTTTTAVAATTGTTAVAAATTATTTTAAVGTTTTVAVSGTTSPIAYPQGGVQTGGSSAPGTSDSTLVVIGAVLLVLATGAFGWRKLSIRRNS